MQIFPWSSSVEEIQKNPKIHANSLCEITDETDIPNLEDKYFNCARSLTENIFDRESEDVGRSIFQSLHRYSKNNALAQRARDQEWEVDARRHNADLAADLSIDAIGITLIGLGLWRGGLPGLVLGGLLAVALVYYTHRTPHLELIPSFDYR